MISLSNVDLPHLLMPVRIITLLSLNHFKISSSNSLLTKLCFTEISCFCLITIFLKLSLSNILISNEYLYINLFIREHDGEFKKRKLWESLPKKMMYQTFCVIIDYLLYSGKIAIDKESKVGWIYNPELARKYHSRKDLGRRK